jgi:hypothetical protein
LRAQATESDRDALQRQNAKLQMQSEKLVAAKTEVEQQRDSLKTGLCVVFVCFFHKKGENSIFCNQKSRHWSAKSKP